MSKRIRGKSKKLTRTDKIIIHIKCHPGFHPILKFILAVPFILGKFKHAFLSGLKKRKTYLSFGLFIVLIVGIILALNFLNTNNSSSKTAFANENELFTANFDYSKINAKQNDDTENELGNSDILNSAKANNDSSVTEIPTTAPENSKDVDETIISPTMVPDDTKISPTPTLEPPNNDDDLDDLYLEDAFEIKTYEDLREFAKEVNNGISDLNAVLMNDIIIEKDASIEVIAKNSSNKYSGIFEGNNHQISGLMIDASSPCQGLFGIIDEEGIVRNLILDKVKICGNDYLGGITAKNYGLIENCLVGGEIIPNKDSILIGGIAGTNHGSIIDCTNNCTIKGGNYVGGITGWNYSIIKQCTNNASILGDVCIGGIAGQNENTISYSSSSSISQVSGDTGIGGIVGIASENAITTFNKSEGLITGNAGFGKVVGINYGLVTNSSTANPLEEETSVSSIGINFGYSDKEE